MSVKEVTNQGPLPAETSAPASSPACSAALPQPPDQMRPHPQAQKSTCFIALCMQRIWAGITAFFRWVFCRSETQKPPVPTRQETAEQPATQSTSSQVQTEQPKEAETPKPEAETANQSQAKQPATQNTSSQIQPEQPKEAETPKPEQVPSKPTPDFSKPMGFEMLACLEKPGFPLKAEDFFSIYASQDIRFGAARHFFIHTCSERIQTWILFALVTKKNPVPRDQLKEQNLVVQCRKDSSDMNDDIDVIENCLNESKPSIRALMQEFEIEDICAVSGRTFKWITIKQENLPRIEALLEENIRATIAKEYGQPSLEPAVKRPPPSQMVIKGAVYFIDRYRDHYTNAGAMRLFKKYTANKDPESERTQELILERLVDLQAFEEMHTLVYELAPNRFDAFYEKLWVSPDDNLAEAPWDRMKEILQEGLPPATLLTT